MSENLPLEAPDIDEEEILGSDDDEQESPKDYCKVKPIFKFFKASFFNFSFFFQFFTNKVLLVP